MRVSRPLLSKAGSPMRRAVPVVNIKNATFYRGHPSSAGTDNPPLFPGITFSLNSESAEHWAIIGGPSSGKTTLLEILRGQHVCMPPGARTFPYLTAPDYPRQTEAGFRDPGRAIQYVGFNKSLDLGASGTRGAYLSARYESRREAPDFSLLAYLKGDTNLNPSEEELEELQRVTKDKTLKRIIKSLNLQKLLDIPVANLSNGQTRRAKVARALVRTPEVLLLDEPFIGLDPLTSRGFSDLLGDLASQRDPRIVMAFQTEDTVPEWVTHLIYLDAGAHVTCQGLKDDVLEQARPKGVVFKLSEKPETTTSSSDEPVAELAPTSTTKEVDASKQRKLRMPPAKIRWDYYDPLLFAVPDRESSESLIELNGVQVSYGGSTVLGGSKQEVNGKRKDGLWWTIKPGDRWGVFGPNGSGKTTLLSLICSDHPQSYSQPIKFFGRPRLPSPSQPGLSLFDIQSRIGQSSPEILGIFPRELSIRQVLENAWADAFLSKPVLTTERDGVVDACLRWFRHELDPASMSEADFVDELTPRYAAVEAKMHRRGIASYERLFEWLQNDVDWADHLRFGDVPVMAQRVALFIRAIIKKPDIIVLDEACSGMDERTKIKCFLFMVYGQEKWLRYAGDDVLRPRSLGTTTISKLSRVTVTGLEPRQALISVSHRQDEVPFVVDRFICLPQPGTNKAAYLGQVDREKKSWWRDIWNVEYFWRRGRGP